MSFPERAESLRAKAHLSGVRLPVLVGITAIVVVVLILAGTRALNAAAGGFSVERAEDISSEDSVAEDASVKTTLVFVHVGGAVVSPGVQQLAEGSRVQDAIAAAGGFAEGAARDALNLARVVVDGEQVVVPTAQELENQNQGSAVGAATGGGAIAGDGKVNINRASTAELDALPGIGPATAEKIVADREANGPFATPEDLKRVAGIGDKKYAELADQISVG